jgi:hypothetical protein
MQQLAHLLVGNEKIKVLRQSWFDPDGYAVETVKARTGKKEGIYLPEMSKFLETQPYLLQDLKNRKTVRIELGWNKGDE